MGKICGSLSKAEDTALKAARLEAGRVLAAADLTDTARAAAPLWVGTNSGIPAGLGSGTAALPLLDPAWFRVSARLYQRPGSFWPRRSQTFLRYCL